MKNKLVLRAGALAWAVLFFPIGGFANSNANCEGTSKEWKNSIVNIEASNSVGLSKDIPDRFSGTGFVVDHERGIIVTNQHIVTESPLSKLNLMFNTGDMATGKVLYYDPWHDFAFIQYDKASLKIQPKDIVFDRLSSLKEGEELCLIGNSSGEQFSIKSGILNRLFALKNPNDLGRYSHHLHLSLSRSGGASGSPVFNMKGKVIGLHTSGKENESFELISDYIVDALEFIQKGKTPARGTLHFSLVATRKQKAERYLAYEESKAPKADQFWPQQSVIMIDQLVEGTPAAKGLERGDILLGIAAPSEKATVYLGENIYLFDRIVNKNIGKSVTIYFSRDGKEHRIELPVEDAEKFKLRRFAMYMGGTFHDVTPALAMNLGIPMKGVYLSEANKGSPIEMGYITKDTASKRQVVVEKLNDKRISNLNDFISYVRGNQVKKPMTAWIMDFLGKGFGKDWYFLDPDPTFAPLKVFRWSEKSLTWEEEVL